MQYFDPHYSVISPRVFSHARNTFYTWAAPAGKARDKIVGLSSSAAFAYRNDAMDYDALDQHNQPITEFATRLSARIHQARDCQSIPDK